MKKKKTKAVTAHTELATQVKPSTKSKKSNRRSADPLNALKKEFTTKRRADLIDFDYLDKLNVAEKLWLAQFAKEEIHAAVSKDPKKNTFNRSKKKIRTIYNNNNARNRCTWTVEKAKGMAEYLEDHKDTLLTSNPEAWIAAKMDMEQAGWVDINGDVLMTEDEVIQELKDIEKAKKAEAKKKK